MKILMRNYIFLAFVILFNLAGLNAVIKILNPPVDTLMNAKPGFTMHVPLDEFSVEPDCFRSRADPDRIFNDAQETPIRNYRYFQINVGSELKFKFEQDAHERIINACLVPKNIRPERKYRTYFTTHVATAKHIQFLLHKDHGIIVGASPPPNQIPRPKEEIGPQQPQVNIGPPRSQVEIGPQQPQVNIGPQQPQVNIGPQQPQVNVGPLLTEVGRHKRQRTEQE